MLRVVKYKRVSTGRQVEGASLQTQDESCDAFASKNGFEIVGSFEDAGESAKTVDRPQLIKMMNFCADKSNRVDGVIVYKLDRLARNTEDHFAIKAALAKTQVRLYSATEPISEDPAGEFMETILAGAAQFDNKVRAGRVKGGMTTKSENGYWVHQPPLGYDNVNPGKSSVLVPNKSAEAIEFVFNNFAKGYLNQAEITRELARLGFKSVKGNAISAQHVNKILRNPIYMGYIKNKLLETMIKGNHSAIISEEIFDQCQRRLNGSPMASVKRNINIEEYPLKGVLICECCGRRLTASKPRGKNKRYSYYHCYKCGAVYVRAEKITEQFEQLLSSINPTEKALKLFRAGFKSAYNERFETSRSQRMTAEKELKALEEKSKKLVQSYAVESKINESQFNMLSKQFENEELVQRAIISDLRISELDIESSMHLVEVFLKDALSVWKGLDIIQKQKFQHFLFPQQIVVSKNGIVGTPVLSPIYALLGSTSDEKSSLVVPRGFEPLLPG